MGGGSRSLARRTIDDYRCDEEAISDALMRWLEGRGNEVVADPPLDGDREGALHNYPGRGFARMTNAQWHSLPAMFKGSLLVRPYEGGKAPHHVRLALLQGEMLTPIYLVDAGHREPCPSA